MSMKIPTVPGNQNAVQQTAMPQLGDTRQKFEDGSVDDGLFPDPAAENDRIVIDPDDLPGTIGSDPDSPPELIPISARGPSGNAGPNGPSPDPIPKKQIAPMPPELPEPDERAAALVDADSIDKEFMVAQAARQDRDAMEWMLKRTSPDGKLPPQPAPPPRSGVSTMVEHRAAKMPGLMDSISAIPKILGFAEPVLSDVATGITSDAGNVVLGGPLLAIRNSLDLIDQAATWLNENVADTRFDQSTPPKAGEAAISGKLVPNVSGVMDQPKSVTGSIMQAMTQFLTGFALGGRVMGMAPATSAGATAGQTLAKGAFSDLAAFKGSDGNLATLIQMVPDLQNPVTAYLAHEGDDSELEKRMQNVLAGAIPNVVFEGFLAGLRGIREYRKLHALVAAPGDQADDVARKMATMVKNDPANPAAAADDVGKRVEDLLGKANGPDVEVRPKVSEKAWAKDIERKLAESNITDTGMPDHEVARHMTGAAETPRTTPPPLPPRQVDPGAPLPRASNLSPEDILKRRIIDAYSESTNGTFNTRGQLSDIRSRLPDVDRATLDKTLKQMQMDEDLILYRNDNQVSITPEQADAAMTIGGEPRHIVWIERSPKWYKKDWATQAQETASGGQKPPPIPPRGGAGEPPKGPPPIPPVESEVYVNWSRINGPEDVKRMMAQMVDAQPEDIAKAQRGVRTNKMTAAAADSENAWKLLVGERKANAAKIMTAEEQLALRNLWTSAGDKLMETARAAAQGGPEELYAFRRMMATYDLIQKEVIGIRTETARALQQWRIPAGSNTQMLEEINNALVRSGGMDFNKEMAARIVDVAELGGKSALKEFIEKSWKAKTADALREIWINAILSGPKTHLVNTLSNTAVMAHSMVERAIAGRFGSVISPTDGVRIGEASAMMTGIRMAYRDAFKLAAKAFKTGQSGFGMMQIDTPRMNTISAEGLGVSADTAAGKALDMIGNVVNMPGRALGAADEFFKTINYRAELYAQAFRKASEEVDRGVLAANKIKERMVEIILDPPDEIATAARDLAKYNTFTNDPGEFSKAVMKIRSIVDHKSTQALGVPSASFVVPFLNTPANIFSYAFERTPIAPIMGRFKADIAAGGARANLAMAKLGLGTAMMTVAYDMAMDGNITGSGPTGKTDWAKRGHMRGSGWQPYSVRVKVGENEDGTPQYRWFAYNRLDPLGMVVGLAADMADYARNHEDGVDVEVTEAFAAAVFATAENLTSKAYLRGFSDFVEAMQDYQYKSEYFANRLLSSFVPTGVKEVANFMDPRAKQTANLTDAIRSRIPGLSGDVPSRLNFWGDEITYTSGLGSFYDAVSPIYSSTNENATPIDREFFKINYFPRHPSTVRVDGRQVKLRNHPEIKNRLVELTAATPANVLVADNQMDILQARGGRSAMRTMSVLGDRTLKQALNDLVTNKLGMLSMEYMQADDNDKWREISDLISTYRKVANMQVLREFPELQEIRDRMPERTEGAEEAPF